MGEKRKELESRVDEALVARGTFEEYLTAMRMLRESHRTVGDRRAAITIRDYFLTNAESVVGVLVAQSDALLQQRNELLEALKDARRVIERTYEFTMRRYNQGFAVPPSVEAAIAKAEAQ